MKIQENVRITANVAIPWEQIKRDKLLYLLLIPGLIYLLVFKYAPMYGVLIAFKDFDIMAGILKSPWCGFDNFKYLFSSSDFYVLLRNSLLISLYRLIWGFPAPILLALMLNEMHSKNYKRAMQTVVYLPHFISWVVIAGILSNMLSPSGGLINHMLGMFGIKPVAFLQNSNYFRSIIVVSDIWKTAGWGTIIYLAAMTGINAELYEAALIDGASKMKRIIHITLPGIASTVVVMLILRMGTVLQNGFEQIFLLYNPLVYQVADVFETFTYRIGLIEGRYGFAAAVGLFQSVVGLVMILATNKLAKIYGEGGLW